MPLDIFDDIFLLHFPLKPAKSAFQGFSILDNDFSQYNHPFRGKVAEVSL